MNSELIEAIGELSYDTKLIRSRTLQTIRDNREEAVAYFLKRLDDLAEDPMTEDGGAKAATTRVRSVIMRN